MVCIPHALQRAQGVLAMLSPFLKLSVQRGATVLASQSSGVKDAQAWVVLLGRDGGSAGAPRTCPTLGELTLVSLQSDGSEGCWYPQLSECQL